MKKMKPVVVSLPMRRNWATLEVPSASIIVVRASFELMGKPIGEDAAKAVAKTVLFDNEDAVLRGVKVEKTRVLLDGDTYDKYGLADNVFEDFILRFMQVRNGFEDAFVPYRQ